MVLSDSICQYCTDTGRSTGSYIMFYGDGTIDHLTNATGTLSEYSAGS